MHYQKYAGVAQLVEQRIRNAKVGGSTPLTGTIPGTNSSDTHCYCGAL